MTKKDKDIEDQDIMPQVDTIDTLKEDISFMRDLDGDYGLFYGLNYQKNCLAKQLKSTVLNLDGTDKAFANFLALSKEIRNIVETTEWLKQKLGIENENIEEEKTKSLPPVEQRHLNKK
jgi:hypothetical protein